MVLLKSAAVVTKCVGATITKIPFYFLQENNLLGLSLSPRNLVQNGKNCGFEHVNVIHTGITCKKISCYLHGSACRWLIFENAKTFQSCVKHF